MASGVSGYAAISARVRAMYSDLLTPQDITRLSDSPDFSALVSALKSTPYGKYLSGLKDNELTPRRVILQIRNRLSDSYSSVVQQAPEQTRPLVRQLFRYFEVGNLKAVLRSIQTVSSWNSDIAAWDRVREVLFPFGSFSTIPAQAMVESGSVVSAVELLRGSPYEAAMSFAMRRFSTEQNLFPLEVALDLNYWRRLWAEAKKLSGRDREMGLKIIGSLLDLNNLMWVIRYRIYHNLSEEELINYTLPFGYRVRDEDVRAIAAGADIASIISRIYPNIPHVSDLLDHPESGLPKLEHLLKQNVMKQCIAAFIGDPFHIGVPLAFLLLSDFEIQDLVVLIEAKSSKLKEEDFPAIVIENNFDALIVYSHFRIGFIKLIGVVMLFPKQMSEVELIVPSKDLVAVTRALSGYGVFHQVDSANLGLEGLGQNTWQETAGTYSALERRIQTIIQNVGLAEEYPTKPGIDTLVDLDVVRPVVDRIDDDVKGVSDQLSGEKKRLELLESQLRQLEPIADVNVEVGALKNSSYMHSILGVVPAANITRLKTSLLRVPHVFFTLRDDPQKPVVWILGQKSNSDVLERAAKSAYLNPLSLPEEFSGTPEQITAMLRKEIESSKQKISGLESDLAKQGATYKNELQKLLWDVHISRVMADAIVRFGQLRHTYVIVGWVPTEDLEGLTARLKDASREILIETMSTSRSGHHSNVPVALTTNKWLMPFQDLITTYGRPSYGEFDPTILIAFTFPLLYGAMFGDLGQGLILMLAGFLAYKFLKGMRNIGLLFVYCGASAAVFGYLYGSIFGFEGHHIEEYLHFHFEPAWFSPMENITSILSITMDVGIVILISSFLLSLFNNLRSRNWAHFWFGHTGIVALIFYIWFLSFLGGYLGDNPVAPKLAVAISSVPLPWTAIGVIFGLGIMFSGFFRNMLEGHTLIEGKGFGGFAMFLLQSFMDIFEAFISMLSNTLSFMRVGAFAVAHGGLSLAIFSLAGEEPTIGFWITILIGNVFIMLLEGLIVYIQTMRLHYYEIFGKFFHGGGMQFEPLKLSPSQEEA